MLNVRHGDARSHGSNYGWFKTIFLRRSRIADLIGADLKGANLKGANLKGANLKGANVTDEQLAECKSLEGATMPDGARHP